MGTSRIGIRIGGAFLVVAAITLGVGITGYLGISSASRSLETIVERRMPAIPYLLRIAEEIREIVIAQRSLLVPGISGDFAQKQYAAIEESQRLINRAAASYEALPRTSREEELYKAFSTQMKAGQKGGDALIALIREWEKDKSDVLLLMDILASTTDLRKTNEATFAAFDAIVEQSMRESARLNQEVARSGSVHQTAIMIGMIGGPLLAALLGVCITLMLTKPLHRTMTFARAVSEGSLDRELDVHRNDELGTLADALRRMVESLRQLIASSEDRQRMASEEAQRAQRATDEAQRARQEAEDATRKGMIMAADRITAVAGSIGTASESLTRQIEDTNRGAHSQLESVSRTASAMGSMGDTIAAVARSATEASETADNAKVRALEGAEVVNSVVRGIDMVQRQALGLKADMGTLGEQAEGIGQIMNVISDIADQTNLLALNAAIEAARAGDAGRGFAVVADEVRKLAEKTMSATRQVGEAIRSIQEGTRKNVVNVESAVESIAEATQAANRSGETLRDIVRLIEATASQVNSIAASAEHEASESSEIQHAIDEVNTISSAMTHAMRQATQAIGELSGQAQALQRLVTELRGG